MMVVWRETVEDVANMGERVGGHADIAETAIYLARLGPYAVVHQIVVDRLGADW